MTQSERRVVLVVDACSDTRPLVDLAVDLVVEMSPDGTTHLHGLFIEDEDLLSLADLPCTREVSQHTAQQRRTSRQQMLELLQRQSQRFYRYLEQEARASQLSWSSSSRSARSSSSLELREDDASCQIFAKPLLRRVSSSGRQVHRILLLENDSPFMLQVLQTVIRQLQDRRLEVVLLRKMDEEAEQSSMLPQVQSWQQDFPLLQVREYPREMLAEWLADSPAFDYVILADEEPDEVKLAISRRLDCSMLLVR